MKPAPRAANPDRSHGWRATWVLVGVGLRGRRRGGTIATGVVLVLAALGMSAGLVVSRQGATLLDEAAAEARVAHLVVFGTPDAIRTVAADPEVRAWSGPFATLGDVELVVDDAVPMQLTALSDPDVAVNRPPVRAGRWTAAADEIVLDRSLAAELGLGPDDVVSLRRAGIAATFTVVGTAVNFTDCFYPQCDPGRAWVTDAGLARFDAGDDVYAQGWLRFDDAAQADPFVQRYAAAGVPGIGGTESWLDTRADFLTLDRVFGSFVTAFGVFVLVVAAVVVAGSTALRVVVRRREIGLLGAIGGTPREVTASLVLENLVVGAIAALLGWSVAGFLAPALQLGIGRTLGPQDPSWSVSALVATVVAIWVLLAVATAVPARRAARRPVTDVLRDVPAARAGRLSRVASGVPARLSWMGVQETATHPTRSLLASLAIVVAVVGSIVSAGFVGAIDEVGHDPARAGDPWAVAVLPGARPVDEVSAVLGRTEGVAAWFSEVERRSTFRGGAFLSVATGGDPAAAAYRIAEGRSWQAAGEAIAGYGFLQRFDVSVGDEIEILAGTTPVRVRIVGMYRDTEDSGEVLRYRLEDLQAVERALVPETYRVVLARGAPPAAVAAAIVDALGAPTRTEILDTGVDDLAPLLVVLRLVALVLLAVAGTNLLSTLLTAGRESAARIGVQLAIGFTPGQIVRQGVAAGAALGLLATIVGVVGGRLVFRLLADAVSSGLGVGPGWMPAPGAAVATAVGVGTVIVAAVLGGLAVNGVARRPVSELVRGE